MSYTLDKKRYPGARRKKKPLFLIFLAASFLVHFLSYVNLQYFLGDKSSPKDLAQDKVKIRYVDKSELADDSQRKQIVETPMSKTERPKDPSFLGAQDHMTQKETKVKNPNTMAHQAGPKGTIMEKPRTPQEKSLTITHEKPHKASEKKGTKPKSPESLRDLLPTAEEMFGQLNAGYQDFVDADVAEGDVVDLNTASFRFLGYVTHLRQAIQLVWTYPHEAAMRGLEGKVLLQFRIKKDGTTDSVKVVQSSGYTVLDQAIVSAIKLASPFAPLPDNIEGDSKVFAGTFHYTLSRSYRSH